MVGWHHQFNRQEFGQTPGDGKGQGSLACCSPGGCRVRHDLETEQQQLPRNFFFFLSFTDNSKMQPVLRTIIIEISGLWDCKQLVSPRERRKGFM